MNIHTIDTGRFTMDYVRFGQGEAPLVILPGVSLQRVLPAAEAIARSYRPLAERYAVYVFERRNDMPAVYPVADMARDTADALEALELGPVNLFGASQGGMMAMVIAAGRPKLVRRLIVGSATDRVSDARYARVFEPLARLARAGDVEALCLAFGEAVYPAKVFEVSRSLLLDLAGTVTEDDLARFITQTEGLKGFDISAGLSRIACPALALGAADDRVMGGEASRRIASGLGDCALHIYEGYGHAAYDLAPDYRRRMLAFLTEKQ